MVYLYTRPYVSVIPLETLLKECFLEPTKNIQCKGYFTPLEKFCDIKILHEFCTIVIDKKRGLLSEIM